MLENYKIWVEPCSDARKYAPVRELSAEQLATLEPSDRALVEFWDYCEEFLGGIGRDFPNGKIEGVYEPPSPDVPEVHRFRRELAEIVDVGDWDLARDKIIGRLDTALRQLDESIVRTMILNLLRPEAGWVELPPELAGDQGAYALYRSVANATAAALVCQQVGGCHGEDHPMVLRTCMEAQERSVGCLRPIDFIDAVYQTRTPIEYMFFWLLLDQANAMLISYRAQ